MEAYPKGSPHDYTPEQKEEIEIECFRKLGDIKRLATEINFSRDFFNNHTFFNDNFHNPLDKIIHNVEKLKTVFRDECPHNYYF